MSTHEETTSSSPAFSGGGRRPVIYCLLCAISLTPQNTYTAKFNKGGDDDKDKDLDGTVPEDNISDHGNPTLDPSSLTSRSFLLGRKSKKVMEQMRRFIFLMHKLLQIPLWECSNYMSQMFVRLSLSAEELEECERELNLCLLCGQMMDEGRSLVEQVETLQLKLQTVQATIQNQLLASPAPPPELSPRKTKQKPRLSLRVCLTNELRKNLQHSVWTPPSSTSSGSSTREQRPEKSRSTELQRVLTTPTPEPFLLPHLRQPQSDSVFQNQRSPSQTHTQQQTLTLNYVQQNSSIECSTAQTSTSRNQASNSSQVQLQGSVSSPIADTKSQQVPQSVEEDVHDETPGVTGSEIETGQHLHHDDEQEEELVVKTEIDISDEDPLFLSASENPFELIDLCGDDAEADDAQSIDSFLINSVGSDKYIVPSPIAQSPQQGNSNSAWSVSSPNPATPSTNPTPPPLLSKRPSSLTIQPGSGSPGVKRVRTHQGNAQDQSDGGVDAVNQVQMSFTINASPSGGCGTSSSAVHVVSCVQSPPGHPRPHQLQGDRLTIVGNQVFSHPGHHQGNRNSTSPLLQRLLGTYPHAQTDNSGVVQTNGPPPSYVVATRPLAADGNNTSPTKSVSLTQNQINAYCHTIWIGHMAHIGTHNQILCRISAPAVQRVDNQQPIAVSSVSAKGWPSSLLVQVLPKHLINLTGSYFLKQARTVLFEFSTPETGGKWSTKIPLCSQNFAGCVHFPRSADGTSTCAIKVLILLDVRGTQIGFIPHDQEGFVEKLKAAIRLYKEKQVLLRAAMGQSGHSITQQQLVVATTMPSPQAGQQHRTLQPSLSFPPFPQNPSNQRQPGNGTVSVASTLTSSSLQSESSCSQQTQVALQRHIGRRHDQHSMSQQQRITVTNVPTAQPMQVPEHSQQVMIHHRPMFQSHSVKDPLNSPSSNSTTAGLINEAEREANRLRIQQLQETLQLAHQREIEFQRRNKERTNSTTSDTNLPSDSDNSHADDLMIVPKIE